jgi:hypothetical protein
MGLSGSHLTTFPLSSLNNIIHSYLFSKKITVFAFSYY